MTLGDLESPFTPAPTKPIGPTREVHVWRANLDDPELDLEELESTLSSSEIERASGFRFPLQRARFVARRGILRKILGRYLDASPRVLHLEIGAHGKPRLAMTDYQLEFNASHSSGLALFGFTLGAAIGVDVERIDDRTPIDEVAAQFFSPREVRDLRALPPTSRRLAFFTCWSRKEAYVKALGDGLGHPLDAFDVSLAPNEPAALLATRDDPTRAAQWTLWNLDPAAGYTGALAIARRGDRLRCWQL